MKIIIALIADGVLSVFEFANRGGWKLVNKALAFADSKSGSNIGWYKISDDNYAISIRICLWHHG